MKLENDLGNDPIGPLVRRIAIPSMLAQFVSVLYSIVDRIYIGHIAGIGAAALTGVGLIFPVVSIVAAFTSLYSSGGAPIFAMARGRKDEERALQIQGTVFALLLFGGIRCVLPERNLVCQSKS